MIKWFIVLKLSSLSSLSGQSSVNGSSVQVKGYLPHSWNLLSVFYGRECLLYDNIYRLQWASTEDVQYSYNPSRAAGSSIHNNSDIRQPATSFLLTGYQNEKWHFH